MERKPDASLIWIALVTGVLCALALAYFLVLAWQSDAMAGGTGFWQGRRAVFVPLLGLAAALGCLWASQHRRYRSLQQEKAVLQEKLGEMAYHVSHDALTGLPNIRSAKGEITRRLALQEDFTAIVIDIDNFKRLNDTYSHTVADGLLEQLAGRLEDGFLKMNHHSYAARMGGDEFLLLLSGILRDDDTDRILQVMSLFQEPLLHEGNRINITACLGIAGSLEDVGGSAEQLIGNAEIALAQAKQAGKDHYKFFHPDARKKQRRADEVEDILREAIEHEAFTVLYQPQIDAATRKLHGFEALARLSEGGISPGEFIPVAENTGLIVKVGRIVTKKVLQQMMLWRLTGHQLPHVAINYSCGQLTDKKYPEFLTEMMKKYQIPASHVEIEVTESLFIGHDQADHDLFLSLAAHGIKMAVDDFGTGYSCLSYLTYLPVDIVKIDKSLVDTYLHKGTEDFMENLVKLLHSLSKTVVVEGVEDAEQFDKLRKYKADIIQGYYFSRPLPAQEAILFAP